MGDKSFGQRYGDVGTMEFRYKDSRRHERGHTPVIAVAFEGKTYNTVNWSLGGFLIDKYDGRLSPGSLLTVEAIGQAGKDMHDVEIRSRVVRVNPAEKQLVVSFLDIDDRAYALLQQFSSQRLAESENR